MPQITKSPASVSPAANGGSAWNDRPSAIAPDGLKANAPLGGMSEHEFTEPLTFAGFGFAVPLTAPNLLVTARVKRSSSAAAVKDETVALTTGDDKKKPDSWPLAPNYGDVVAWEEYGPWTGLTPAQINDPSFGLTFAGRRVSGAPHAQIDAVELIASWDD